MRVLFISNIFPAAARTAVYGIFNRMGLFIDAIKGMTDELELLVFAPPPREGGPNVNERNAIATELWGGPRTRVTTAERASMKPNPSLLDAYFSGLFDFARLPDVFHGYFYMTGPEQVAAIEECLDRKPDWIFAHRLVAMGPLLAGRRALPPIVFDLDDVEHQSFLTNLRAPPFWPGKVFCYLHIPSLMLGERRAIRRARMTFVCSTDDRDRLRRLSGTSKVEMVPNSVPLPNISNFAVDEPTVALISSLTYPPNGAAVDFMVETIWPMVYREVPNSKLLIVGAKPELVRTYRETHAGVTFTGFVDDLEMLYRRTRIVVCPVRAGGGTRLKIIEAAAYGKPVVSTTFGASGLEFRDGRDILLRDDPKHFAAACVSLLNNTSLCHRLGEAARQLAERHYSRESVLEIAKQYIARSLPEIYPARVARSGGLNTSVIGN